MSRVDLAETAYVDGAGQQPFDLASERLRGVGALPDGAGWVLTVEGVGEGAWASNGYDDYGSLGAYTVSAPECDGGLAPGVEW